MNRDKKPQYTKLTSELRTKLAQEGRCFYCREAGHIATHCPKKASRPTPGKINIREMTVEDLADLRAQLKEADDKEKGFGEGQQ